MDKKVWDVLEDVAQCVKDIRLLDESIDWHKGIIDEQKKLLSDKEQRKVDKDKELENLLIELDRIRKEEA